MKLKILTLLTFIGLAAASQAQVLLSVDFNAQFYNQTQPGFTGLAYTTVYPVSIGDYTLTLTSTAPNMGTGSSNSNPVSDAALWKDFAAAGDSGTMTLTLDGLTPGDTYTFTAWSWRDGLGSTQNVVYTPISGTGGTGATITYTSTLPTALTDYDASMQLVANGSGQIVLTVSAGTFNGTVINGFQVSAVPEPSAAFMFGLGTAATFGLLRRGRRTRKTT